LDYHGEEAGEYN